MTLEEAKELLERLSNKVATASRLTRPERTQLLKAVYGIDLSADDRQKLMQHIIETRVSEGANRGFIEAKTNKFALPLRYIFGRKEDRSSVSRWSGALNQLDKMGVEPKDFGDAIKRHGGILSLYWASRSSGRKQKRQSITLNKPVEFEENKLITLTLRANSAMIFDVISVE